MAPRIRYAHITLALALVVPRVASAQGELQGRVLADGGRRTLANAEVSIPKLGLNARSDSSGRYRLQQVPRGDHLVVTRAVGFKPDSVIAEFDGDEALVRDLMLVPSVTSLEEVHVEGKSDPVIRGPWAAYEQRKARGIGHFLDGAVFEHEQRPLSDVLNAKVPGLTILRGAGNRAWAATGRATSNAKCALCRMSKGDLLDKYDLASGAPLACYADVYLDGAMVYSSASSMLGTDELRAQMPLFNLNRLAAQSIRAIEVYTSTSQIPSQYIRTGAGCGLVLIWTTATR